MSIDLTSMERSSRVFFAVPLAPVQGSRFQPTGFPGLGAATFQTPNGQSLLVESAQSMANRLEMTCWDEARQDLKKELDGLSHVRVMRKGRFLTDTILEAHRLNSPYLLESKKDKMFLEELKKELGTLENGPIDRRKLADTLLKYDIGSLIHGVFLAKGELAGGRLRVARALSAFIEADDVRVAPSGGVKNDHVFPAGETKTGFGNVPFARDEFTAGAITLYVNLDLGQIRGYGLGSDVERLLVLLALFKLRSLLNDHLRLRTACDLKVVGETIRATNDDGILLPPLDELLTDLKEAIAATRDRMRVTIVSFEDELKNAKKSAEDVKDAGDEGDDGDGDS